MLHHHVHQAPPVRTSSASASGLLCIAAFFRISANNWWVCLKVPKAWMKLAQRCIFTHSYEGLRATLWACSTQEPNRLKSSLLSSDPAAFGHLWQIRKWYYRFFQLFFPLYFCVCEWQQMRGKNLRLRKSLWLYQMDHQISPQKSIWLWIFPTVMIRAPIIKDH